MPIANASDAKRHRQLNSMGPTGMAAHADAYVAACVSTDAAACATNVASDERVAGQRAEGDRCH
jgi:hypothetical protein